MRDLYDEKTNPNGMLVCFTFGVVKGACVNSDG